MQWWCAAQTVPWTWAWRPYPGVWLFVAALILLYLRRRHRTTTGGEGAPLVYGLGVGVLWIALDWPVGALGGGYLAWVHMVQFVLIALLAPPLLLLGFPRVAHGGRAEPWLRRLARPAPALFVFLLVVVATHWPSLVDRLMASQWGSLALDLAWLGAGTLFWSPVVRPPGNRDPLPYVARVGYLILGTVLLTGPYIFLTFAELPFYATYELAPPVGNLGAREDQRIAGVIMRIGGGLVLWTAIAILFYRWYRAENVPGA